MSEPKSESESSSGEAEQQLYPLPEYIRLALEESGLLEAFRSRPTIQQNSYASWVDRARRLETKERRLEQLIYELKRGDVFMKMAYRPDPGSSAAS